MRTVPKARIFLSDNRSIQETGEYSSMQTFNGESFSKESKAPADNIYLLNDVLLGGGRCVHTTVEQNSFVLLLPVAGAIHYSDPHDQKNTLAAGQLQMACIRAGGTFSVRNPFQKELVNFVHLSIKAAAIQPATRVNTYDVNQSLNNLQVISPEQISGMLLPFRLSIGKFRGRGETCYLLQHQQSGVFVFSLQGAFEVDGRLLHPGDGLALWDTKQLEMEALSNDAIIFLLEQW